MCFDHGYEMTNNSTGLLLHNGQHYFEVVTRLRLWLIVDSCCTHLIPKWLFKMGTNESCGFPMASTISRMFNFWSANTSSWIFIIVSGEVTSIRHAERSLSLLLYSYGTKFSKFIFSHFCQINVVFLYLSVENKINYAQNLILFINLTPVFMSMRLYASESLLSHEPNTLYNTYFWIFEFDNNILHLLVCIARIKPVN